MTGVDKACGRPAQALYHWHWEFKLFFFFPHTDRLISLLKECHGEAMPNGESMVSDSCRWGWVCWRLLALHRIQYVLRIYSVISLKPILNFFFICMSHMEAFIKICRVSSLLRDEHGRFWSSTSRITIKLFQPIHSAFAKCYLQFQSLSLHVTGSMGSKILTRIFATKDSGNREPGPLSQSVLDTFLLMSFSLFNLNDSMP